MDIQQHALDQGASIASTLTYSSAGGAVYFGLTLNDLGVIVGIAGVVIGVVVNFVFRILSYRIEKKKAGL